MTYILEWVDPTGWKQDLQFDYARVTDCIWEQVEIKHRRLICKNQIRIGLQLRLTSWSPDQAKNREPGWSTKRSVAAARSFSSHLDGPRIFVVSLINFPYIFLCKRQLRKSWLHTQRKCFLGKGIEHYLRNRLRSGFLAVPKLKHGSHQVI